MLESLKEFTTSTFNTAMNRVKNPAFGAFAISWCAFNWKQILYLFFADNGIYYKIEYISENSNWFNIFLFPIISSLVLCIGLPWLNNAISKLQSKPLDNADSIENFKQARKIQRSTRLQRLKAKHDVTYDKVKTGAEKDIQTMKEDITKSQERMGELTKEIDTLKFDNNDLTNLNSGLSDKVRYLEGTIHNTNIENEKLKKQLDEIKGYFNIETKTLVDRTIPITNTNSNGMAKFHMEEKNNHSQGS